jgi:hypothetical protein
MLKTCRAVTYQGGWFGGKKHELNSQFCGKYIYNNLIRIRVSHIYNWVEPLSRWLLPPDPHSLCLLSSTELAEPLSWVRHWCRDPQFLINLIQSASCWFDYTDCFTHKIDINTILHSPLLTNKSTEMLFLLIIHHFRAFIWQPSLIAKS